MVTDLSMNLKVYGVPTTREDDGLAMSSRNNYLTEQNRKLAPTLYKNLLSLKENIELGRRDFSKMLKSCKLTLNESGFKVDYIEIRAADTLLQPGHEDTHLVILAAAFLGKTRLIDNLQIELKE